MARSSDRTIKAQLDQIVELLRVGGVGSSREALSAAYQARFGVELPPRTLQRRLERLIVEGRVRQEGEGKRTVYRTPTIEDDVGPGSTGGRLSAKGLRLRELVKRPITDRAPTGYEIGWLLAYKPGRTWYLSKADRTRLHELGRTPDEDRPAGTFAKDVLGRLLIDLSWASSRLEGNTYSRLDTQNLLEFGQRAEGKDAAETQMILNHKAAIEYIVEEASADALRPGTVLSIHALLSENLLTDQNEEGRLRDRPVEIGGSSYTPTAIPQIISEAFARIVATLNAIPDPFEQAFFAMAHVAYLQPFVDANKRTSRLVANLALLRADRCPLSFVGADEEHYVLGTLAVYEHRRTELLRDFFLTAYARSAAQYRVVTRSVPMPDPVRLRYRDQLRALVHDVVIAGEPPNTERIRARATDLPVSAEDRARFEELALELLLNLNEGSAARYRLRPSEFSEWQARVRRG